MDQEPPYNPYQWSPLEPPPPPPPASPKHTGNRGGLLGVFVALGAAFFKYGFLVLKLFKFSTLFSALITYAFLVTVYGWQFALGIVGLLLIHEFGHMVAATREGLPVTAPIFALMGAFVRTPSRNDARQDAFIAITGPAFGLLGALLCGMLAVVNTSLSGRGLFYALMSLGCLITIFNLIPIGFLDGGKIARVLTSSVLYFVGVLLLVLFALSGGGVILIVAVVSLYIGYRNRHDPPSVASRISGAYCLLMFLASLGLVAANNAAIQNGIHF